MVEVHSEQLKRRYSNSRFSFAYLFWLAYYVIIIVVPFALAYSTHQFWQKNATYFVQPSTSFDDSIVYILEGQNTYLTWSSTSQYNSLFPPNQIRPASVSSVHYNENDDDITDLYDISISVPLTPSDIIQQVTVWLPFECTLDSRVKMYMSAIVPLSLRSPFTPIPGQGATVSFITDMTMFQRGPITSSKTRTTYASPPLDLETVNNIQKVSPLALYDSISTRNETLHFSNSLPLIWNPTTDNIMTINLRIRVPVQEISYVPSIVQTIKWAWVQYIVALVTVWWLMREVRSFVYRYQIISTYVTNDTKPPQKAHYF